MSETAGHGSAEAVRSAPQTRTAPARSGARVSLGMAAALVTGFGGLATGAGLAAMLSWSATPDAAAIEPVVAADIDAAAGSLFGPSMVATVEAAKSCRRPLAFVTVQATGETLGTLRFRSGDYVSPNVKLGRNPFRLALPFPAPVSAGSGQIIVISDVGGAAVYLRPGVVIPPGVQQKTIHVTWNPALSCPAAP